MYRKFELDNSKFGEVRQFRANIEKKNKISKNLNALINFGQISNIFMYQLWPNILYLNPGKMVREPFFQGTIFPGTIFRRTIIFMYSLRTITQILRKSELPHTLFKKFKIP